MWKLLKFNHLRPKKKNKTVFLGYCRLLEGYTCLKTPIVIHSCNHFERSSNFLLPTVQQILKNIFNFQFCHYKARKNLKNILDTSSCLRGTHILEHCTCFTYLGGQPNFYNQWFARYGFWAILGLLCSFLFQKMGFAYLSAWSLSRSWK